MTNIYSYIGVNESVPLIYCYNSYRYKPVIRYRSYGRFYKRTLSISVSDAYLIVTILGSNNNMYNNN